jgi:hypothetical protein
MDFVEHLMNFLAGVFIGWIIVTFLSRLKKISNNLEALTEATRDLASELKNSKHNSKKDQ